MQIIEEYMNIRPKSSYSIMKTFKRKRFMYNNYRKFPTSYQAYDQRYPYDRQRQTSQFTDYGPHPFVVNIEDVTVQNETFRTALWTGNYMQLTLMSIPVGEDIGLEVHSDLDQFIRVEEGEGLVKMGGRQDRLDFVTKVYDDFAFIIPAGKWHNLINTGSKPLKVYSIYAPPQHPYGTVHQTKEDE